MRNVASIVVGLMVIGTVPVLAEDRVAPGPVVGSEERFEAFRLDFADPRDVLTVVRAMAHPLRLAMDDRLRQIFVSGDERMLTQVREVVDKMDRPAPAVEIVAMLRCLDALPNAGAGATQLASAGTPCGGGRVIASPSAPATITASTPHGAVSLLLDARVAASAAVLEGRLGWAEHPAAAVTFSGPWTPSTPRVVALAAPEGKRGAIVAVIEVTLAASS